ncbi:hypothetical protein LTR17_019577 [Elasticomyces elasticus]|nr:hypothetical protein LTR17_019577 [Elasticomyces elasticus]
MDLAGMLNNGPEPDRKAASRTPPGASLSLSRQTSGLTPLQTTSQGQTSTQYQYPSQHSQSPAVQQPPGSQYQSYGSYSATTPGGRPPGQPYQYPQASPSQQAWNSQPTALSAAQGTTHSHSPTPPSQHGHTPQSMRQSPLSTILHGPSQQHQQQQQTSYQYQHSQPSTPLGPPPLQYSRTSTHGYQEQQQSPYHQRQSSITSNGLTTGSPAAHLASIGNILDSPGVVLRQSPHVRPTSEYLTQVGRDRSLSVSPKTKVIPRTLSQSSRQSSQAENYGSARSSLQHQHSLSSLTESQNHVTHHSHPTQSSVAYQESSTAPPRPSEVTQRLLAPAQTPYPDTGLSAFDHSGSLSQTNPIQTQPPPAIQHQSQRLGMNHLLTPASSITAEEAPLADIAITKMRKTQEPSIFMKPSPKPKRAAVAAPPTSQPPAEQSGEDRSGAAESIAVLEKGLQQGPLAAPVNGNIIKEPSMPATSEVKPSNKRPASEAAAEPPAKRGKARKYTERPAWASLHPKNPAYKAEENGMNGTSAGRAPPRQQHNQQKHRPPVQTNGSALGRPQQRPNQPQPNGTQTSSQGYLPQDANPDRPWSDAVPLDRDLLRTRHCLGLGKWEKSIRWTAPMPEMLKQVMDWLYVQLNNLQDVPDDPNEVEIEIEAKIGQIVDAKSGQRVMWPITSPTILNQGWATKDNIKFESQMEGNEHKAMNGFLNSALQKSKLEEENGRVAMDYSHPKTRDSFLPLSDAGYNALPASFRRHANKGDLRLRTTTNTTTGEVEARIVKTKISDLHIYNPAGDYDCRISLNLEANMNHRHFAPFDDLSDEWAPGDKISPPRMKDRMSYKHLVYQIDLTMVTVSKALPPKYELELEVQGQVLREQLRRLIQGGENAFADVVNGFLDNATWLMRQKVA